MPLNPYLGMNILPQGMQQQNPMQQIMAMMSQAKPGAKPMLSNPGLPQFQQAGNSMLTPFAKPMMKPGLMPNLQQGGDAFGIDQPMSRAGLRQGGDMFGIDAPQSRRFQPLNFGGGLQNIMQMLMGHGMTTGQGFNERNPWGTV